MANEMNIFYSKLNSVPGYLKGQDDTLFRFDHVPTITREDIDRGYIERYFATRSNVVGGEIVEISKQKYQTLQSAPIYTTAKIRWRISGALDSIASEGSVRLYVGVIDANTEAAKDGDRQIPGMKYKLPDPLEFYQGLFA